MNRRDFITRFALCSGAMAVTPSSPAGAGEPEDGETVAIAGQLNPLQIGFENAPGDCVMADLAVEGVIPSRLSGIFYRNGPGQHTFGGEHLHHWFDGDGYVQRWAILGGKVSFAGRFVDTPKRRAEQAAGRFLYRGTDGDRLSDLGLAAPDDLNVANTNVLAVNGGLWALWEAGSAVRLDPQTLAAQGVVTLNEEFAGAPFGAHPRRGEDGRIWNIGSLFENLALYRLRPDGSLEAARVHKIPPIGLVHDFLLTSRSLVVLLSSTRLEGDFGHGYLGAIKGRPDLPMEVWVFDRESFDLKRVSALPAGFSFHFGNAHEDSHGTITFDMVYSSNTDLIGSLSKPMDRGKSANKSMSRLVTLAKSGAVTLDTLRTGVEFPRVSPHQTARRHRYVYVTAVTDQAKSHWFDSLARLDVERGNHTVLDMGADWLVEEHIFVPDPEGSAEDHGWLIGTALNWRHQKTALGIFDARHLDRGPLARIALPFALPLGLHGQFVPVP